MKPHKIYASHVEPDALKQFYSALELDCVVRGALMPDAHTGYTLPIGGVVATEGVVFPSFVGYDIGCGMCAAPIRHLDPLDARRVAQVWMNEIYAKIPVGMKNNDRATESTLNPGDLTDRAREAFDIRGGFSALGTLGSGNHFIEIGEDETGQVWIVIHSGSRGPGWKVAQEYMKLASGDGKAREGHYGLRVDSQDGQDYINDMNWMLSFALDNRKEMMHRVDEIIGRWIDWDFLINRNHNHATVKVVDGQTLWIHRKGATHAEEGMDGVIPGNMRDGSFIVRGKGNPDSLWSSSHGAGRVLGRAEAKKVLTLDQFSATMQGVVAKVGEGTLDEAPMAYKDIFQVMREQADLVEIVHHVRPILNIKG